MKSLHMLMLMTALAAAISTRASADELEFTISESRSNFRADVIDWIYERNATVGWVSDFALPGSKMPVHLDVDPGDKEVVLEWKIKFR